jgi:hypothetical protein
VTPSEAERDREIAMAMRLWDLGIPLDGIAAALGLPPHQAAGIVHTQLCTITDPAKAAQDARLVPWWGLLRIAARDVHAGHRRAVDVATEYGVPVARVRRLADAARDAAARGRREPSRRKRGPGLRDTGKGKLITAYDYGHDPTEAAGIAGVRILTARRYLRRYADMTPAEKQAEAERVGAYRWALVNGTWYDREDGVSDA